MIETVPLDQGIPETGQAPSLDGNHRLAGGAVLPMAAFAFKGGRTQRVTPLESARVTKAQGPEAEVRWSARGVQREEEGRRPEQSSGSDLGPGQRDLWEWAGLQDALR